MPESADRHGHTSTEDEAFITGARLLGETLKGHPFALGFLAIFAAAAIFLLGVRVGEIAYLAFDGEGMMVAVFGATFVTALVVIIVIGVLLDRRAAHPRCGHRVPHRPATSRLRAYVQPPSPLVRWYQPAAVAAFIALAAPESCSSTPHGTACGSSPCSSPTAPTLAPLPGACTDHL